MTQTAKLYGDALYDLADEEGRDARILSELTLVQQIFADEPDYLKLLETASLSKQERCQILDEALRGRVDGYLLNFLKVLCEAGHLRELKGCTQEYRRRWNEAQGILAATAVTAVPMDAALQARLAQKLEQVTGKQIDLQCRVDPRVLGGIRLEMDGKQLDGTTKNRLEQLKRQFNETVL